MVSIIINKSNEVLSTTLIIVWISSNLVYITFSSAIISTKKLVFDKIKSTIILEAYNSGISTDVKYLFLAFSIILFLIVFDIFFRFSRIWLLS